MCKLNLHEIDEILSMHELETTFDEDEATVKRKHEKIEGVLGSSTDKNGKADIRA